MAKSEYIDFSEDRLFEMAASFMDDHNYIGALKMLRKNAEINGADDRTFMMCAEIYDDLGSYEECINSWFKYLDCAEDPDLEEAYEGLAVAFMQLDNEQFSAYYYNKMLIESEDLSAESRKEIIDCFIRRDKNPLRFAWPPEIADYSPDILEGVDYVRNHEPEKAVECFERVPEVNGKYIMARNYIAMTYVLNDMYDNAEAECNNILSRDPGNVQALTTLAAVRTEQKRTDEAKAIAEKLVELNVADPENIYKIATVCCENKMHKEAYRLFCKLDEDTFNTDRNLLYFRAVSAYNCGKTEACFDVFDALLAIYPDSVVAAYQYGVAREHAKDKDREDLSYFYRLPVEMREQSLEFMTAVFSLSPSEVQKLVRSVDALECIKWCFDETESAEDNELHHVAALCAIKAGYDDYVRELLLNAFLPDGLKISMIRAIGERNENNQFGVVVCNIYKCIDFYKLDIGRLKRKYFVGAYAILVSHFGIIDENYSMQFAAATEDIYHRLERGEALALCKDSQTLAAVIISESGIRESEIGHFDVCDFFEADKRRYENIMHALRSN